MSTTAVLQATPLPDKEFDKLVKEMTKWVGEFEQKMIKWAPQLARLNHVQKKKLRKELRITNDRLERFILFGEGVMAQHLALRDQSIRASIFKRLPASARKELNDENAVFPIVSERGVSRKSIGEMNPFEINRLVDADKGIRTEKQQRDHMILCSKQNVDANKLPDGDMEEYDRLVLLDAKTIAVVGKEGSKIKVPRASIRKFA